MYHSQKMYDNISPLELSERQCSGEELFLLDVRTPQENAADSIDGSHLIPLHELAARLHEIPRDREIVAYCRVGNRSAYASAYLSNLGYRVKNLEGGIMLWNMTLQPMAGA